MTTKPSSATAEQTQPQPSLIERATESTRNLAWIQDYTTDWQTLRSVAIRITKKQNMQSRKDETAYDALLGLIVLCDRKITQLEQSYEKMYSAHERLMIKLESEVSND